MDFNLLYKHIEECTQKIEGSKSNNDQEVKDMEHLESMYCLYIKDNLPITFDEFLEFVFSHYCEQS